MEKPICSVEGCDRDARGNGLCVGHDQRVRRTGQTGPAKFRRAPGTDPEACKSVVCDRPADSYGWCKPHWERFKKGRPVDTVIEARPKPPPPPCSIDGCDDPSAARGWCSRHYHRWIYHGDPGPADIPRYGLIEVCSADGCEREHRTKGWCDLHYRRWKRGWDTTSLKFLTIKDRSPITTYAAAHGRIAALRGRASEQPCIGCGNQARTWAYQHNDPNELHDAIGHPYSLKYVECYEAMCTSCHNILDRDLDERQARRQRAG